MNITVTKQLVRIVILLTAVVAMQACQSNDPAESGNKRLQIVATTGMIGDAISIIVGDSADVNSLMGPGVDPHLYKPTQSDIEALRNADIIFYNGLHLEGKMGEILEKLGESKPVIAFGEGIDKESLLENPDFQGNYDPHIWFSVPNWSSAVKYAGEQMLVNDTANSQYYKANLDGHLAELATLDSWVNTQIQTIPDSQRVMITAHDAFGYFGQAYGVEVTGLQGLSTAAEYGLKDVTDMVDFIVSRGIKSVFVESSVSDKSLQAVIEGCQAKDHNVTIGGTLYSDAMGAEGTPEGTYVGMVRHNVTTIVEALR